MRHNTPIYSGTGKGAIAPVLVLSMALLIGTASVAHAQGSPYNDPLRDDVPLPPISTSSPYGTGSKGIYVLPGTRTKGLPKPARALPALPPRPAVTMPPASARPLPSTERLKAAPLPPLDSTSGMNHRAETPATLRYIRPATRMPRATYPVPQPAQPVLQPPVVAQPMLDLQPQTPVQTSAPVIPFGQPSAPIRTEPQVTVERAIAVEPEWTPPPASPQLQLSTPSKAVTDEFDALTAQPPMQPQAPAPVADTPALEPLEELSVPAATPTADVPPAMLPLDDAALEPAVVLDTAVEPVETRSLSEESREIIKSTPSGIDSKTVIRSPEPVIIRRTDPNAGLIPKVDVRAHEEMGLKIEVRQPDANIQSYLEEGYENLLAGRTAIAAGYYEEAVKVEPNNETALFGLATTYQRMGQMDAAREAYSKLFALNPTHREGLNNFMALISQEAPEEAITELEKLETENPDFSPIPAQLGVVYNKIGNPEMAARKLARALNLSRDNVSYKYNLAITLDRLGQVEQASTLYLELIEAYNAGASLPGDVEDIRNRVIFINSQ